MLLRRVFFHKKGGNMKFVNLLVILAALGYGCFYLYQNHYFDSFLSSVDNTVERTSDFATDKAVKEANY